MAFFTEEYLNFFKSLAPNNHKEWFDLHRKDYEKHVKKPFYEFTQAMIDAFKKEDKSFDLEVKQAVFRINRDIRFSKDKTPYKLQMSCVIGPDGRKGMESPGLYIQLDPEHARFYSGLYRPSKPTITRVRQKMCDQPQKLRDAIHNPKFKKFFGEVHGEKNKIIPKEFKEAAADQPLIYNKAWYYFAKHDPEIILKDDLVKVAMDHYKAAKPVNDFLIG